MKAVICDECKRKAELESTMGFIPDGWLTVTRHHDVTSNKEQQFCSPACAVIGLSNPMSRSEKQTIQELQS